MPHNAKQETKELLEQLEVLRSEMVQLEETTLPSCELHSDHLVSARNLLHYVALRRHDIRGLQQGLADLGLSSLGRTESHVLSAVDAVLGVLSRLEGAPRSAAFDHACDLRTGRRVLEKNTDALLGAPPEARHVRIMVTMPSEAAQSYELVRELVVSGMNCMRINCAHDGPTEWSAMVNHLHRAEQETGMPCKISMDLAGPKLRTGPIEPGVAVTKYRPKKDVFGRVQSPARIWLTTSMHPAPSPAPADATLRVTERWISQLQCGDEIRFRDTRGSRRIMTVTEVVGPHRWAEAFQTAYLAPGITLTAVSKDGTRKRSRIRFGAIPHQPQTIQLKTGEHLILTRSLAPGRPAVRDESGRVTSPAQVGVSLPEVFDCVRPGEPIWFDDGKIGGTIVSVEPEQIRVEITYASPDGAKLGGEKGINLPDSDLRIPSLTSDDEKALEFAVQHADIIGYSFVRKPADVRALQRRLSELDSEHIGVILKIETRQGFENLPQLLLAAMKNRAVGVMIARGDLAVECGYQRLAELQEEILWISEAAHVPVVWATQVLESLVKTGMPSRSEITDAAMGERAECVMLNKGPYLVDGVRALDDILRRMESHQEKKRSMLRKLHVAAAFTA
jgi:pyruvate kinase